MYKTYYLTIIGLFISLFSLAQNRCHTTEKMNSIDTENPDLKQKRLQEEQDYLDRVESGNLRTRKSGDLKYIQVVVHVLYHPLYPEENISTEIIQSQIDVLNADFSATNTDYPTASDPFWSDASDDWNIRFELATEGPNGNPTDGIERISTTTIFDISANESDIYYNSTGGADAWDTDNYLNIWILDIYEDGTPSSTLGYALLPEYHQYYPAEDGIVCNYWAFGKTSGLSYEDPDINLGRTMTHEVGHFLGLRHIWGDATCGNDFVADTPVQEEANFGGINDFTHPHNLGGCVGNTTGEMYMNFMDYGDDAVLTMFTYGQKARVEDQLRTYRPTLLKTSTPTALNSSISKTKLEIYPNPANDKININSDQKIIKVEIYNTMGNLLITINTDEQQNMSDIDISILPSGTYIVKATTETQIVTNSLIKK